MSNHSNEPTFVFCTTELVKMCYSKELVSGLMFYGTTTVAMATRCGGLPTTYEDGDHNPITEQMFNAIKEHAQKKII